MLLHLQWREIGTYITVRMMSTPNTTSNAAQLTPYTPGSLKEFSYISIPLMFAALSGTLMLFLDRLVLAHYSTDALNGCVNANVIFNIFEFAAFAIVAMSEVFVGQYNGAQQYDKIGEPVWQMLIFSALTALVFWPVGLFAGPWLIPTEFYTEAQPYFQWLCFFGPVFSAVIALMGFYIGRGKVKFITLIMVLGNLVNLGLNILLVFGIEGWFKGMGSEGSAIASGLGQSFIAIALAIGFLSPHSRRVYKTHRISFCADTFIRCLKLGTPSGIGHCIAFSAWAFLIHLLAETSEIHMTVMAICQSIWILLYFITDGLQKGMTGIAANYLGARQEHQISKVLSAAIQLIAWYALASFILLFFFPDFIILPFLNELPNSIDFEALYQATRISFRWLWLCLIFDTITWAFAGLFTASGDTRFIMIMEIVGSWFYCVVPGYFFIVLWHASPTFPMQLTAIYTLLMTISFYLRYLGGRWKKNTYFQVTA